MKKPFHRCRTRVRQAVLESGKKKLIGMRLDQKNFAVFDNLTWFWTGPACCSDGARLKALAAHGLIEADV